MDDDSTYERFTTEIAGARVLARVPVAAKKMCERLMRKSDHNEDEADYLHENYWVEVHYRGQLHGYKGTDDIWTYSARNLPEFLLLYEWMSLILGKRKLRIDRPLQTTELREDAVWAEARRGPFVVQVSFRPRGIHAVVCPLRRGPIRVARVVQRQNATGRFPVLLFRSPGADRRVGHSGV